MSGLFTSGGQIIGVSVSASVLPMNTQDWSALGWAGWISLQSKGLLRFFSNTRVQKLSSSVLRLLYGKMDTEDRNSVDLTEAEDIKKRWQ